MEIEYLSLSFETIFLLALCSFFFGLTSNLLELWRKLVEKSVEMLEIFCWHHREVPILLYFGFYPVCFISNSFELYFLPYLYIGISLCYVIYLFFNINFYINFLLFLCLVLIIYLFILGMRSELFMFLQLCCFKVELIGNDGSEMIFFTGKTISETAKVLASKSAYKGFSMTVACSNNSLSSDLLSYVWIKPFLERGASGLYMALNDLLPSLMLEHHGVADMQEKAKEIVLNSHQVPVSNPFSKTLDYYKASYGASDMPGKQAALIVCCKHFASGLEQVSPFPVSPGFWPSFMLSKYTSPYIPADNMLMHEALAVMHMKPLFNDAEITRTFMEKQGDFFASLPDYKLAGEIKTFDSPFNEYTMNARLATGVEEFFSNSPKNEGLKSLLVLDASVTPVSSEEEFRIIKNGVLAKCDPINLDKFDLITCRQDLLSLNSKPGLLILHESEQRLLYPKLSSKLQEEYESFDAYTRKLWEDQKMREKYLDFLLHKQKAKQVGGFWDYLRMIIKK